MDTASWACLIGSRILAGGKEDVLFRFRFIIFSVFSLCFVRMYGIIDT